MNNKEEKKIELPPPILVGNPLDEGGCISGFVFQDDCHCPECSRKLTWIDPLEEWACLNCEGADEPRHPFRP
jgi:hypothetical protein